MDEAIRIIITGGTFDKQYDEIKGELTFSNTHLPSILEVVRCTIPIQLEINRLKDSLFMDNSDRLSILESCKRSTEKRIIITHGTDTMADTAKVIAEAGLDAVIVLTGAMVPYSISGSDAVFNLGCSIAAVQLSNPGVYICMNGRVFPWNRVRKNKAIGRFEYLS